MASDRTVSFVEPQKLTKQVSSVSYQGKFLDERLENMIWAKNYDYKVSTVDQMYIQDSLGYRPVTSPLSNKTNNFGFGYAVKYQVDEYNIAKFSVEKAYRLPTANETLGDGLLVRPSPELGPEESTNLNFSWFLSQLPIGSRSHLSVEPSVFYRNVSNLIQYRVNGNLGAGASENVSKVRGYGGALDMSYSYTEMFRLKGNVTYQQLKDWNEFVGANPNLTYKDLLPNTPYLMANGEFTFTKSNLFRAQTQFSFFWDVQYVHEFYLNWPSLGNQNKAEIPTQLVNGTGISYSMDSGKYNISAGCQNVFDKQVYDNYLLQKPGRSFYIKLRYFIN